ncbi:transcription factor HBP-1b(c38)-like [Tripterygium wilfordii]|uniref:Transcription factor HBP-1b(C38)-like n=1 Tax=Tripterygium wilfordii TaxID=458696 RepID=A0A7J7DXI3_TRIWF|nr:protein RESPONSE TO ABA AND SALT 1-like [Tripterygium wilfordii]KAF5750816.1 transcription factor HBP-1b(c38)-like [Tripterygium wilfordii]
MSSGSSRTSTTTNAGSFESFLEIWLVRQEHYLEELLSSQQHSHESRDEDLRELIDRVLSHYHQYYVEKSRAAQRDIFLVFSPKWFTTFERTFLWISGFKPGLVFRLAYETIKDLAEDQRVKIANLSKETKVQERSLNDELAKIQESVASPPLLEVARTHGRVSDPLVEAAGATETMRSSMESVVASADLLRMTTAVKMVEILNPVQNVRFLAAATQLQLRIRSLGLQRDAERGVNDSL